MREKILVVRTPLAINPFFFYSLFWIITILLYLISPSRLNMPLDIWVIFFLVFTIIFSIVLAIKFNIKFKDTRYIIKQRKENKGILFLLIFGYIMEMVYSHYVPILLLVNGKMSQYQEFGIPTFHVILVTFSLFYCIENVYIYISFKDKYNLLVSVICIAYFICIFSRGMLVLISVTIGLLILVEKEIKLKHIVIALLIAITGCWLFGVVGNIREGSNWNDSSLIMNIAAIPGEKTSIISPFYWTEEYIVCSLRNLNFNILYNTPTYKILEFLYMILPDFLSKRLFTSVDTTTIFLRVRNALTTPSTYGVIYCSWGYLAMLFDYFLYVVVGVYVMHTKYKDGIYMIIVLSILSVLFGLTIFDNMLWYSGYSFSIIWGLVLGKMSIEVNKKRKVVLKIY